MTIGVKHGYIIAEAVWLGKYMVLKHRSWVGEGALRLGNVWEILGSASHSMFLLLFACQWPTCLLWRRKCAQWAPTRWQRPLCHKGCPHHSWLEAADNLVLGSLHGTASIDPLRKKRHTREVRQRSGQYCSSLLHFLGLAVPPSHHPIIHSCHYPSHSNSQEMGRMEDCWLPGWGWKQRNNSERCYAQWGACLPHRLHIG